MFTSIFYAAFTPAVRQDWFLGHVYVVLHGCLTSPAETLIGGLQKGQKPSAMTVTAYFGPSIIVHQINRTWTCLQGQHLY